MNTDINAETIVKLRELYRDDASFGRLVDWFSERQKNSREMPVRVAGGRTGLSEGEVKRVFREMQVLQCGRYMKGSRNHENRMRWYKSIISIAAAAKGEAKRIDDAPDKIDEPLEEEKIESAVPAGFLSHSFALRRDVNISFSLPADLTAKEAERLAGLIQSLPFDA